jgi:hypothetical protein
MRKKLKLSFECGDSGNKKFKRGYGGYDAVWRNVHLAGVWSRPVGFVLAHLAGLGSVAVKMFSFTVVYKDILYKVLTFNAICNDNAIIHCITVQRKNVPFPSTLTGHMLLLLR